MKKKIILSFMLGVLLTSTVGYAAYKYQAADVDYTPKNSEFKIDNVESAINELYSLYKDSTIEKIVPDSFEVSGADRNGNYTVFHDTSESNTYYVWEPPSGATTAYMILKYSKKIQMTETVIVGFENKAGITVNYKIYGSNDGTNWISISDTISFTYVNNCCGNTSHEMTFENKSKDLYKYYKIELLSSSAIQLYGSHEGGLWTVDVYGYQ